jgi:hypothetical protein
VVVLASVFTVLLVNYFMPKKLAIAIFLPLYRTDTICILGDGLTRLLLRWYLLLQAWTNLLYFLS